MSGPNVIANFLISEREERQSDEVQGLSQPLLALKTEGTH